MTVIERPVNDTRSSIIEKTLECISRWGMDKVTLNDVAREAKVTRPTVYSYFSTRDELIRQAMMQATYGFVQRLMAQVQTFEDPESRYLCAFMTALEELPNDPHLKFMADPDMSQIMGEYSFRTPEATQLTRIMFREILSGAELDDQSIDEIMEMSVRFLLSLLTIDGPIERDPEATRDFLVRRLLPMIGLQNNLKAGSE